jgi:uncharacterized protein (TIGR03382 family)
MRRALLLAALGLPAVALGQIAAPSGAVIEVNNFNVEVTNSYINAAHCADTDPLDVEWNIIRLNTALPVDGTYRIYASNEAPATSGDGANFCPEQDVTSGTTRADLVTSDAATVAVQQLDVSGSALAAAAEKTCGTGGEDAIVFVCVHLYDDDGVTRRGFASGKFQIQVRAPNPPTGASAGPGDTRINVSWTPSATGGGAATADSYTAEARLPGSTTAVSSASTNGNSVTIENLVNGTTYDVVVYAFSVGGNRSAEVSAGTATPAEVDDFWETYRGEGGRETGGCASGGAAGILAVAGVLAALRRRK